MRGREAVWITGVGTANPLGATFDESADGLLAGRPAVRPVTHFDVTDHPSRVAGWVDRVAEPPGWDGPAFGALGRAEQLFLWCAAGALRDAGWWGRRSEARV